MGSSSSKHAIDIEDNNKITIAVLQCLNELLFVKPDGADKYSGKHLEISVTYGDQVQKKSVNFTKNAIWEQGTFQFTFTGGVNSFELKLESDASPQWGAFIVDMNDVEKYPENGIYTADLVGSGTDTTQHDGAHNPGVKLQFLFTRNIGSRVVLTREDKSEKSLLHQDEIDKLDDGDIILYSGEGKISSLIKNRFYRPYSHCGIVVHTYPHFISKANQPKDMPNLDPDRKYRFVMESVGPFEMRDPFRDRQSFSGVTFYLLEERVKFYEGHSVQCLKLNQELTPQQRERFITSCFSMHGARLPFDVLQASVLLFERLKLWNIQSNHSVFCSELVAIILIKTGLILESNRPSNVDPGEVADFSCFNPNTLKFLKFDL